MKRSKSPASFSSEGLSELGPLPLFVELEARSVCLMNFPCAFSESDLTCAGGVRTVSATARQCRRPDAMRSLFQKRRAHWGPSSFSAHASSLPSLSEPETETGPSVPYELSAGTFLYPRRQKSRHIRSEKKRFRRRVGVRLCNAAAHGSGNAFTSLPGRHCDRRHLRDRRSRGKNHAGPFDGSAQDVCTGI